MDKDSIPINDEKPLDDMDRIEKLIDANHKQVKGVLANKDNQDWFHVDISKK